MVQREQVANPGGQLQLSSICCWCIAAHAQRVKAVPAVSCDRLPTGTAAVTLLASSCSPAGPVCVWLHHGAAAGKQLGWGCWSCPCVGTAHPHAGAEGVPALWLGALSACLLQPRLFALSQPSSTMPCMITPCHVLLVRRAPTQPSQVCHPFLKWGAPST